jgi:hypothetical protein
LVQQSRIQSRRHDDVRATFAAHVPGALGRILEGTDKLASASIPVGGSLVPVSHNLLAGYAHTDALRAPLSFHVCEVTIL